jgi:hypothetical protein
MKIQHSKPVLILEMKPSLMRRAIRETITKNSLMRQIWPMRMI